MRHRPQEYAAPSATVDVAILTVREGRLCVLLARREKAPFAGALALPGGYVHVNEDEDLDATARRVLLGKAGLSAPYLEQLYTFSGKLRDARGWSLSVAYYAVVPAECLVDVNDRGLALVGVDVVPALPFDHSAIVGKAVQRLRGKSSYSTLPMFLLDDMFTMSELQSVYESVMGIDLDKGTFRRRMETQGIIEAVQGQTRRNGAHRPAQLFCRTHAALTQLGQAF